MNLKMEGEYKVEISISTLVRCLAFFHLIQFDGKRFESHMTVLYPNPCYNEVHYKGTALFDKQEYIMT